MIYAMLTKGEEYTGQGQDYYEERYRQRVLLNLSRRPATRHEGRRIEQPTLNPHRSSITTEVFLEISPTNGFTSSGSGRP
jgi:hypothetical protein